ncbi:unnamed protein product [Ectocarpus sp. CCAP 1310/34]|nr:unnamed protein product [Ectocarpus sp. CCAP 1310/34]
MLLFVVRRLQELGRRKKIPLYMCFVDLKKAYDSVDRDMPWKVLARAGIPAKMIKIIRQFQDGMRARVRMDDGELSGWFFVTQGVRQGCPHCCSTSSSPSSSRSLPSYSARIMLFCGAWCAWRKESRKRGGGEETPLDRKYAETTEFRYLGGLVNEHGDLTREINYMSRGAWACLRRYGRELFDRMKAPFRLKFRLLQAEAMEGLLYWLYGCTT